MLQHIVYTELNSRQQENYNFQKLAAILADYGFNCMWLNDDWQGADFIACHIDGITFLKVQLKGRLSVNKKYIGKDIYIAFFHHDKWYLYPHDEVMAMLLNQGLMTETKSWDEVGSYHWKDIPKHLRKSMTQYAL